MCRIFQYTACDKMKECPRKETRVSLQRFPDSGNGALRNLPQSPILRQHFRSVKFAIWKDHYENNRMLRLVTVDAARVAIRSGG